MPDVEIWIAQHFEWLVIGAILVLVVKFLSANVTMMMNSLRRL